MACQITFKDQFVPINNQQFDRLLGFLLEVSDQLANQDERVWVDRVKALYGDDYFWPGRGIDINEDFPDIEERKFWCRMFFDTARFIFERKIGSQEYFFWQAQSIYQAYGVGLLFQASVQQASGPRWVPDTIDFREFEKVVNKKER